MLEIKKLKSQSHGITEFLVRYRRTYVLKYRRTYVLDKVIMIDIIFKDKSTRCLI